MNPIKKKLKDPHVFLGCKTAQVSHDHTIFLHFFYQAIPTGVKVKHCLSLAFRKPQNEFDHLWTRIASISCCFWFLGKTVQEEISSKKWGSLKQHQGLKHRPSQQRNNFQSQEDPVSVLILLLYLLSILPKTPVSSPKWKQDVAIPVSHSIIFPIQCYRFVFVKAFRFHKAHETQTWGTWMHFSEMLKRLREGTAYLSFMNRRKWSKNFGFRQNKQIFNKYPRVGRVERTDNINMDPTW